MKVRLNGGRHVIFFKTDKDKSHVGSWVMKQTCCIFILTNDVLVI